MKSERDSDKSGKLSQLSLDLGQANQSALDPEAGIVKLHKKSSRNKIHIKDIQHWWDEQLKKGGVTQANKQKRIEEISFDLERRLKEAGAWHLIEKKGSTYEERQVILGILKDYQPPIRDLDSSEGFTIYPSVASWLRDLHDVSDL